MRLLLDEMFPPDAARQLREVFGHDAAHVGDIDLAGAADADVAAVARDQNRAVVTENVADFIGYSDLVVVCVLKRNLPSGGAQAGALATLLDRWARGNPSPYLGQHWPT